MVDDLHDLSKEELITVITKLLEEKNKFIPFNKVSVADVEVESNTESLNHIKKIADGLIKENSEFITLRKEKLNHEKWGYIK